MGVFSANWPATGGNYSGTNANAVENALNGLPVKPLGYVAGGAQLPPCATVVAAAAGGLPGGTWTYNNGAAGVGATLTAPATGTTTVDGHVLSANDIVLVTAQPSGQQNGPYLVTTAGAVGVVTVLTRVVAMNSASDFTGALVTVGPVGTAFANTIWVCGPATVPPVIGTTVLTWVQPTLGGVSTSVDMLNQTVGNMRIQRRVVPDTSSPSALSINTDVTDVYKVNPLNNAMSIATTGTPLDRDGLTIVIQDNGTPQVLTYAANTFQTMGVVGGLPASTLGSTLKKLTMQFFYDADDLLWTLSAIDTVGY